MRIRYFVFGDIFAVNISGFAICSQHLFKIIINFFFSVCTFLSMKFFFFFFFFFVNLIFISKDSASSGIIPGSQFIEFLLSEDIKANSKQIE